jgi:hypothetical protein
MSEPTAEDRLRWATYAVNAGYAIWSEDVPDRTVNNKEAYFTLFSILEAEHKKRAANEDKAVQVMAAVKKHLNSGRGINLWPATNGVVVEVEGMGGDLVGEDLCKTIMKALTEAG